MPMISDERDLLSTKIQKKYRIMTKFRANMTTRSRFFGTKISKKVSKNMKKVLKTCVVEGNVIKRSKSTHLPTKSPENIIFFNSEMQENYPWIVFYHNL